ncbi:hypothetical protein PIB30_060129 [Stylosanthes scabra]|uniref:WAT1-related protein n=1 Tax=Stylosanthes scabra TaxID=79078 RepID=A0ABU6YMC4_9FABA|nr:hypothetical protein [Stylosanthes scabra]
MEKATLKSSSTQAKIIGSVVSIIGAPSSSSSPKKIIGALIVTLYKGPTVLPASSTLSPSSQGDWVLGAFLLAASYTLPPLWYIVQGFCGCLVISTWGVHLKGSVYVSAFKPLSVVIAAAMSVMFLGDALFLGSVIGAGILSIGFYAVLWGKAKSSAELSECLNRKLSACNSTTPLLHKSSIEDELPIFDGIGNGYGWSISAWEFWNRRGTPEVQRLAEVSCAFFGRSLIWFQLWSLRNPNAD